MNRWLLLLLLLFLLHAPPAQAQQQLVDFTKIYFRSNPFTGTMRQFLEHLTRDPEIEDKRIQRRTSDQFFSFSGRYKKYNKFFFVADSVRLILQEMPIPDPNNINKQDTIMVYQISAYGSPTPKGRREVQREWEKIKKVWSKKFFENQEEDVVKDNVVTGKFVHLFLPLFTLSPLTIGWTTVSDPERPVLTITLRLKQDEEYVSLPGALNSSQ